MKNKQEYLDKIETLETLLKAADSIATAARKEADMAHDLMLEAKKQVDGSSSRIFCLAEVIADKENQIGSLQSKIRDLKFMHKFDLKDKENEDISI